MEPNKSTIKMLQRKASKQEASLASILEQVRTSKQCPKCNNQLNSFEYDKSGIDVSGGEQTQWDVETTLTLNCPKCGNLRYKGTPI